jgi:AhpD family alkylhydroperoxidase
MPHLPSLPAGAVLVDVFRAYPDSAGPLLDYHEVLMRGPSPLSMAERELVAAYVSGVNSCGYCHGVHTATAAAFGVGESTLTALLADIDTAPVEQRHRCDAHGNSGGYRGLLSGRKAGNDSACHIDKPHKRRHRAV